MPKQVPVYTLGGPGVKSVKTQLVGTPIYGPTGQTLPNHPTYGTLKPDGGGTIHGGIVHPDGGYTIYHFK